MIDNSSKIRVKGWHDLHLFVDGWTVDKLKPHTSGKYAIICDDMKEICVYESLEKLKESNGINTLNYVIKSDCDLVELAKKLHLAIKREGEWYWVRMVITKSQ